MEIKTKEQALEEIRDIEIVLEQKKHLEVENKGLIKQVEDLQAKADEAREHLRRSKTLKESSESLAKQAESLEEKAEGIDLIQKGLKRLLGTLGVSANAIQTPGKVVSQIDNAEVEYVIHDEGPVIEHITTTNEAGKVLWAIKKLKDQGKEPVSQPNFRVAHRKRQTNSSKAFRPDIRSSVGSKDRSGRRRRS